VFLTRINNFDHKFTASNSVNYSHRETNFSNLSSLAKDSVSFSSSGNAKIVGDFIHVAAKGDRLERGSEAQQVSLKQAKDRILAALNCEKPFERCVCIEDNKIICEFDGDEDEASGPDWMLEKLLSDGKIIIAHGHPSYSNKAVITSPVSLGDFLFMNKCRGCAECIVFNARGEYSILRKSENFKSVGYDEVDALVLKYQDSLVKLLSEEKQSEYEHLRNYLIDRKCPPTIDSAVRAGILDFNTLSKLEEIYNLLSDIQETDVGIKAAHDFWIKNAKTLGLVYETNYSNL